jgi:protein-S-isoprenylcysteine O-methyltransferase Ste14
LVAWTASIAGLFMMVGGLVGLILRREVLSPAPVVILLQVGAVVLMVSARLALGMRSFHAAASPTKGGLVTSGPYRWIRHPIYTAVCLFAWACFIGHSSRFALAMALLVTAGGVLRMLAEESLLRGRYPEYVEYARRTNRMVPYVF